MRNKYRSAIYSYSESQNELAEAAIKPLQKEFDKPIITKVLPFVSFKLNQENYLDYFQKNPDKAFCRTYIYPKLSFLTKRFSKNMIDTC